MYILNLYPQADGLLGYLTSLLPHPKQWVESREGENSMLFEKLMPDRNLARSNCHDLVWLLSNEENFLSKNRFSSWELSHWIQQDYVYESRKARRVILVMSPQQFTCDLLVWIYIFKFQGFT